MLWHEVHVSATNGNSMTVWPSMQILDNPIPIALTLTPDGELFARECSILVFRQRLEFLNVSRIINNLPHLTHTSEISNHLIPYIREFPIVFPCPIFNVCVTPIWQVIWWNKLWYYTNMSWILIISYEMTNIKFIIHPNMSSWICMSQLSFIS